MANLPINYGDTGKVARDKINDSFDALEATVEGYRPHIEDGIRWIGTTNTGVKAEGDSIVMKVEDGYIWYKSESNSWTQIIAVADLKGPQGNPGADGNGIASITSTKVGKTTTVTITETGGTVDTFQVLDGADGVGGDGDVKGPDSSTNGHMAVFDGTTGKIIRDGGSIPTGFEPGDGTAGQILRKTNSGYEWDDESAGGGAVTSVNGQTGDVTISVPTKVSDLTNDSGYLTSSTGVTTVNGNHGAVTVQETLVSGTNIKTINNESLLGSGDITITGGGSDIEYVTQAEYTALLPGAESDGKHYFIYTPSVIPPTPWQPGVNTLAYFPLVNDTLDQTGNLTLVTPGTATQSTIGYTINGSAYTISTGNNYYVGVWCKVLDVSLVDYSEVCSIENPFMTYYFSHLESALNQKFVVFYNSSFSKGTVDAAASSNQWHHFAVSYNSTENKSYGYIDGVQYLIYNGSGANFSNTVAAFAGWNNGGSSSPTNPSTDAQAIISDFILESVGWTAQEVSDYFNQTKANYGIS